jgi:hypothetical protein
MVLNIGFIYETDKKEALDMDRRRRRRRYRESANIVCILEESGAFQETFEK